MHFEFEMSHWRKEKKRKENQLGCATQWHKCHDQDYGFYFSSHTNRLLCKHTAQESSLISLIVNTRKGDCDNKAWCFSHRVIHGYYSGKIIFTELQCEYSHRDLKWIQMVQHEGGECGAVLFVAHQSGIPASAKLILCTGHHLWILLNLKSSQMIANALHGYIQTKAA